MSVINMENKEANDEESVMLTHSGNDSSLLSDNLKIIPTAKYPELAELSSDIQETQLKKEIYFTVHIYNEITLNIKKPLISLKMALFVWFAAAYSETAFIPVFYKQRGLAMEKYYTMNTIAGLGALFGPTLTGVIADKIGRTKPILLGYILVHALSLVSLTLSPNFADCNSTSVILQCDHTQAEMVGQTDCDLLQWQLKSQSCESLETNKHDSSHHPEVSNCTSFLTSITSEFGNDFKLANKMFEMEESDSENHMCDFKPLSIETNKSLSCPTNNYTNCYIKCETVKCSKERSSYLAFYTVLHFFMHFTLTTTFRLFDVTSMSLVKKYDSDFGINRVFSIFGGFTGPLITGFIVRFLSSFHSQTDYTYGIITSAILAFICCVVVSIMNVPVNEPGKNMMKKSFSVLKNIDIIATLIVLLVAGSTFIFNEMSTSWFLEVIGASPQLIGAVFAIGNACGLPFLFTSRWWIDKIGVKQIFLLGLVSYFLNNIAFSYLEVSWPALFLSLTKILTYHLFWVNTIVYFENIAPEGLKATVVSTAGVVHYLFGRIFGSTIGGIVKSQYDERMAFRMFGFLCAATALLYILFLVCRHFQSRRNVPQKFVSTEK